MQGDWWALDLHEWQQGRGQVKTSHPYIVRAFEKFRARMRRDKCIPLVTEVFTIVYGGQMVPVLSEKTKATSSNVPLTLNGIGVRSCEIGGMVANL